MMDDVDSQDEHLQEQRSMLESVQSVNLAHLPPIAQATTAAIGAVVSNALVYPLDLVTTRMQSQSLKTKSNQQHRYLKPSWIKSNNSNISLTNVDHPHHQVNVPTRRPKNYKSILSSIRTILEHEPKGFKACYNGIIVDSLATLINSFLYFYIYTALSKLLVRYYKRRGKKVGALEASVEQLLMGSFAGMISKFWTCPLSNITVRLQTTGPIRKGTMSSTTTPSITPSLDNYGSYTPRLEKYGSYDQRDLVKLAKPIGHTDSSSESSSSSSSGDECEEIQPSYLEILKKTIQSIYEERGYKGFWSGYKNHCLLSLNPSLTLYFLKIFQRSKAKSSSILMTFLNSAIASSLSTILTYPLTLSKTLTQLHHHHKMNKKNNFIKVSNLLSISTFWF